MKQITQNYKTGVLKIEEVPAPLLRKGGALVRTSFSLISAGTERATLEISKKGLVGKAKARPDLVKQVLATTKKIGVKNTFDLVRTRLNSTVPLGYSLSGIVEEISDNVCGIHVGDEVACAGAGYANHAEQVFVPQNLMAKIPRGLSHEDAAFTTVGSIALHGVRQANVGMGDNVGVIGLGLVGQLTVALLKAQGCRVCGIDLADYTVGLAKKMGVDLALLRNDPVLNANVDAFSRGIGLDSVIITAGTDSNDPFLLAAELLRDKGTLVVVGGIRMEIVKSVSSLFYHKEIDIKFSRSYGPGRYDVNYEEKGVDYPVGYVRWTEQRNMTCFLDLLAAGRMDLRPIITHIFSFKDALEAYELIEGKGGSPYSGILFKYDLDAEKKSPRVIVRERGKPVSGTIGVGMIGAGNFAQANILPFLKGDAKISLNGICTAKGLTARSVAEKFGFAYCTSGADEIVRDENTQVVFIATRHDSHAYYVAAALRAGKHVFVEKPLCLDESQLNEITEAYCGLPSQTSALRHLMVGYNRRFAPLSLKLKEFVGHANGPVTVVYRVNAGAIPSDNWYQDPDQGGRFIGEGCHFVDYGQFLTDSAPLRVTASGIATVDRPLLLTDDLVVTIEMENGSLVTVIYSASGDASMPKERIEFFGANSSAVLDDFKVLTLFTGGKKRVVKKMGQDKGNKAEVSSFLESIELGRKALIPFESLVTTSRITFAAIESLRSKGSIAL